jgi:polysaccharide export outer membrane protein
MKTATFTALSFLVLLPTASAQTTPAKPSSSSPTPVLTMPATKAPQPASEAVPPPATVPVGTSGASVNTDYRLVAGDKLRIEVYKDAQLSQALQIRPDGKITLPLVGDVPAAGRTSVELRDAIGTVLKDYITNPVVTVIVVETSPQVVYVTGEVNKPGPYAVVNGQMNVLQALAMAGGFTDFAKKKDIRILRKNAAGMQTLKFNYKDALDDENKQEPLQLQPGDTIIVR